MKALNRKINEFPDEAFELKKLAIPQKLINKVHNQDCIEFMKSIPSGSVNMVFADPPFNLKKEYLTYRDNIPFEKYIRWTQEWLEESYRILADDGSLFVYNIPKLLTHTSTILNKFAEFKHWISWNSNGQPLGKTMQPAHYGILFYSKNKKSKFYDVRAPHKTCRSCGKFLKDYGGKEHLRHHFGYQISDVWDDIHRIRHKSKRISNHPCQLPVHLLERLILMVTDEGDTIFDPFCGGGSAAVATRQMGRNYIGTEISQEYCDASNHKLQNAKPVQVGNVYLSMHLGKIVSIRNTDIEDYAKAIQN